MRHHSINITRSLTVTDFFYCSILVAAIISFEVWNSCAIGKELARVHQTDTKDVYAEIQESTNRPDICRILRRYSPNKHSDQPQTPSASITDSEVLNSVKDACDSDEISLSGQRGLSNCSKDQLATLSTEHLNFLVAVVNRLETLKRFELSCLSMAETSDVLQIQAAEILFSDIQSKLVWISGINSIQIGISNSNIDELILQDSTTGHLEVTESKIANSFGLIRNRLSVSIKSVRLGSFVALQNELSSLTFSRSELREVTFFGNEVTGGLTFGADYQDETLYAAANSTDALPYLVGGDGGGKILISGNKISGELHVNHANVTAIQVSNNKATSLVIRAAKIANALHVTDNKIEKDLNLGVSKNIANLQITGKATPFLPLEIQSGFAAISNNDVGGDFNVAGAIFGSTKPLSFIYFHESKAENFLFLNSSVRSQSSINFYKTQFRSSIRFACVDVDAEIIGSEFRTETIDFKFTKIKRPLLFRNVDVDVMELTSPRDADDDVCWSGSKPRPNVSLERRPADGLLRRDKLLPWPSREQIEDAFSSFALVNSRIGTLALNASIREILISSVEIQRDVYLLGRFGSEVDLSNSQIRRGLFIDSPDAPIRWEHGSKLILRGTNIDTFATSACGISFGECDRKSLDGWSPVPARLDGVRIQIVTASPSIGENRSAETVALLDLPSDKIIQWLKTGSMPPLPTHFNPQPFAMFAKILSESGYRDAANDLHAYRTQRLLEQSDSYLNHIKAYVGRLIGYGYKPDGLIIFLAGVVAIGWFMWLLLAWNDIRAWFRSNPKRAAKAWPILLASPLLGATIRILPNIAEFWSLTPRWERAVALELNRDPYAHWYFVVHSFIGTACLFLLITPLTGMFD
ncbi:hypothetical protein ACMYR2_3577 [Nitrobacter sp. TKz-YC01]